MASIKLTEKSQEALVDAQRLAQDANNPSVEGLHLLAGLLAQQGGIVPLTLQAAGVDPRAVQSRLGIELEKLPKAYGSTQVAVGEELRRALRQAEDEASQLKDEYVSTEHLLLALASGNGPVAQLLQAFGLKRDV